ncbi:MAG: lipopolysaccharide biosynthesis protein [Ruminococcus sp.]|nr:lipopolysaccharide biosynthesis protein [Ruminococcus sp.]
MAKKNECYLDITLKNESDESGDIIVSFSGIFKMLKKYFLIWIVTAVVAGVLVFTCSTITSDDQHKILTALISFSYDGIEEGLDPEGNTFDVNTIKNPTVIESALTELGLSVKSLEKIRQNISIDGIIPSDAIDKITTYKSVYENVSGSSSALSAAQAMLDISYYPTQFKVTFNYSSTDFDEDEAVDVFNTMLECYHDYFISTYGSNEVLGSAVKSIDYTEYDYAEAVDIFNSTLTTLKSYVDDLASEDTTRFRSNSTGYTFSDLSESISTIQIIDLDILSSYITVNNVTKDKDSLITYYQYRIDSLTREKTVAEEKLASIVESIDSYQKDTIMVFGNGTETTDTEYSQYSEEYDTLINQKISTQAEVSNATQRINYYNQRITSLKSKAAGLDAYVEKVEEDLASLSDKVDQLIDDINTTADEYYENVPFANAYNILVPASGSGSGSGTASFVKRTISSAIVPLVVIEALLVLVYICAAFVFAIINESKKKKALAEAESVEAESESESEEADTENTDK